MKIRSILALVTASVTLMACDGLRQAFTAHVDVAAKAEDQELSVNRLSDLLGNSAIQIPVNRETAGIVTDLWINYQLLGTAAARGDTALDPKLIDEAAMGITANYILRQFMESVTKNLIADSASEATYTQANGGVFVARHILFSFPGGATQPQKDSVRRRAETVRGQVTAANFAALARRHSGDPGSAQQGGSLGAFRREEMVKPFGDAVAALRPGEISGLVETQYGYHIIQRPTYAEAKAQYDPAFAQGSLQRAESVYVAKVDEDAKINVRANAAAVAKEAARDVSAHRADKDVMASYKGGELTTARFISWVEAFPPQQRIMQQMGQAPDSIVRQFVKSIARNEVLLQKADSAGIKMPPEQQQQLYAEFRGILTSLWQQLGLDPKSLADSAKSAPERERVAAVRVEGYLDRVMAGQAQPISVPMPVQSVLRSKYEWKTHPAGVDRGVERARKLRATADSARTAQQPRSQVPLPMPPSDSTARDTAGRGKRP
jgi:hypothetical protein